MARRPDAEALSGRKRQRELEEGPPSFLDNMHWGRLLLWIALGMTVLAGTLLGWRRTEDLLIRDDRFRLAEPQEFAGQSPSLIVEGIHYASPSQIRHVFAPDLGRSLYLVPIDARRQALLEIDWVEEAAVSRVWPDTLRVRIEERRPIAFIHLPARRKDGLTEFALIDKDGFILRPRVAARFTLPVINGIREAEDREDRRARVRRVISMLEVLGPLAGHISEIDVSDPNNLIVAQHMDGRVLSLMLGDENYSSRMKNFIDNYNEIKTKRPDAANFDLRVDNMITVAGEQR
ncbi:MAG: FtsQ-type POTRA domain-containing protein [Bryobacteraceae bacterium]